MRWEDERYVRLYTRDSATWALLPWQSRCLLPLLLRKVDRAGVLEVLPGEEVAAIAELVKVPLEVVEPGLEGLRKRGVVVLSNGRLCLPTFLAAQEARQSDKIRQQKSRELAAIIEGVSHDVTRSHTASQDVTPSRAVPSRAVPLNTGPAKKPRAKRPQDPRLSPLIGRLKQSYFEVTKEAYWPSDPDVAALRSLLGKGDDDGIDKRWRKGLTASQFETKCATFLELAQRWNALGVERPSANAPAPPRPRDTPTQHVTGYVTI